MAGKPTASLPTTIFTPRRQQQHNDLEANSEMKDKDIDDAPIKGQRQEFSSTFVQLWNDTVDVEYTDLICLVLCLVTGLCDSSAYNAWSCFLGMQTGNTIFLGLGASGLPTSKPWGWLKSLVSITSFFIGTFTFANVTRHLNPHRRGTLITTFLVQCILIVIAVALIEANLIPHTPQEVSSLTGGRIFLELIPICLLAFQSAGSMAASRGLGYNEIPTVVLTSVYFDIASDSKLAARPRGNVKRNRRVGSVLMLLIGAVVGGWLSRSSGGMQSALWMAAGIKFAVAVTWLFWRVATPVIGEK